MTDNTPRIVKVRDAAAELPVALAAAMAEPGNLEKWEAVEKLGATIHRQSRLLAGKTRGG